MKNNKAKIFVPMDTAAMSMGSNDVAEKIKSIAENQNKNIEIIRNGSWGIFFDKNQITTLKQARFWFIPVPG